MKKIIFFILLISLSLLSGCNQQDENTIKSNEERLLESKAPQEKSLSSPEKQEISKEGYTVKLTEAELCLIEEQGLKEFYDDEIKGIIDGEVSTEVYNDLQNYFIIKKQSVACLINQQRNCNYNRLQRDSFNIIQRNWEYLKKNLCIGLEVEAPVEDYYDSFTWIQLYDEKNKRMYYLVDKVRSGSLDPSKKSSVGKRFTNLCKELDCNSNDFIDIIVYIPIQESKNPFELCKSLDSSVDPTLNNIIKLDCDINQIKGMSNVFVFKLNLKDIIQKREVNTDISKCSSLGGFEHYSCVLNMAENNDDYNLCEYHNTQKEKDDCYNRFAFQYYLKEDYDKSEELCNKLIVQVDTKRYCLERAQSRTQEWMK